MQTKEDFLSLLNHIKQDKMNECGFSDRYYPFTMKHIHYYCNPNHTFHPVKNLPRWLVYALDRETRKVVAFKVGRRTNRTLSVVLQSLFLSKAKMIYTDKLKKYSYLIS